MTNNEFDGPNAPMHDEHEFKETPSFKEVWKNSPMLKLLTVGAALILVIGFFMMSGDEEEIAPSNVRRAADVKEVVGAAVDEQYEKAIKEADRQRFEEAQQNQSSFIPTPRGALKSRLLDEVEEEVEEEDPLLQWRRRAEKREQERQKRAEAKKKESLTQQVLVQNKQEAEINDKKVEQMTEIMAEQMQSILQSRAIMPSQRLVVSVPVDVSAEGFADSGPLSVSDDGVSAGFEDEVQEAQTIIIPAGEVFYGQLITTANSDVEGPILANIYSGPLRGARLIGTFTRSNTDLLVLSFNKIVIDGLDFSIDAVAVDPATTSPGMATEVNHHWLTRVILPGAAAFIEGLAEAYAEQENTLVVTGETVTQETKPLNTKGKLATGIKESTSIIGEILEDEADKVEEATVIVASGTPIGILFLEPLTD